MAVQSARSSWSRSVVWWIDRDVLGYLVFASKALGCQGPSIKEQNSRTNELVMSVSMSVESVVSKGFVSRRRPRNSPGLTH